MVDQWAGFKVVGNETEDPWASFKPVDMGGSSQPQGVARFAVPAIGAADSPAPYSNLGEAAIGAGKALATGAFKGLVGIGTLPGNIESLGRAGINSAAGLVGVEPPVSPETLNPVTYNNLMARIENRFGELPKPKTVPEEYIQTIGEFIPGAGLVGGLTKGARAAQVLAPAVASETAGQLTEGSDYEALARVGGALAGGSVANLGARTVTPAGRVDTVRGNNVQELNRQGVTSLLAGEKTGNARIRSIEDASLSMPGGGRTLNVQEKAMEQFTGSALKKLGVTDQDFANLGLPGARATDEVLEVAANRIGKRFENVASAARVVPDRMLQSGLTKAVREYTNKTSQGNRVPAVQSYAQEILTEASKSGGMTGQKYLAIRSSLRADQRSGDGALRNAATEMVDQLDAAMIRSAPKNLRPQVAKYIQDNNRQWRDFLAIRGAMSRQGEVSSAGLISPQRLNAEIKKQHKNLVSRNNRELGRLARAGDDVMRPLKSSGTAERTQAINLLKSPSSIATGGVGAVLSGGDPLTMLASYAAPLAIQAATARGISNPTMQRYLANQRMPGRVNALESRQAVNALAPSMLTRDEYGPQTDPALLEYLRMTGAL
jgi:hypothetical protein